MKKTTLDTKEKRAKFLEILPEPGKPKTIIDAKADAFWKEEATKNDLLFFAIPQTEYLKGSEDIDTGKFKNNPGWSVNGCKTIFGFNYLLNNNGTLAHEFGHAFGLEHTFSDEKEVVKKKEKEIIEINKLNNLTKSLLKNMIENNRNDDCWKSYKFQFQLINDVSTRLNILKSFRYEEAKNYKLKNIEEAIVINQIKKSEN